MRTSASQQPLAIGDSELRGRDLAVSDGDAPAPPEQVERPLDRDRRQVVRAARFLTPFERDGWIGPERRLQPGALRHIDLTARRPE